MTAVIRKTNPFVFLTIFLLCILWAGPLGGVPEPGERGGASGDPTGGPHGPCKTSPNDNALFIAGLPNPGGSLAACEKRQAWVRYANAINPAWENFARRRLQPMREWASGQLAATSPTIFYPFSGPDFINVYTLFPRAQTYLLVALEPVGKLPDFAAGDGNGFFPKLQRSLYDLLHLDFFITAKMADSLNHEELKGVLPVLLFFLAREKAQILEAEYWVVRPDGTAAAASNPKIEAGDIPGVRIVFQGAGSSERQTLYYFRVNLRDDALKGRQHFLQYLKSFDQITTFAKAASYLMFKPHFSGIREFILHHSQNLLQDDSAIPLRYFAPAAWNLCFYGTYTTPITLFSKCFQPELASIYKKGEDIRPLPFGIGYRHRLRTSNLMLASRKPAVPVAALAEDGK